MSVARNLRLSKTSKTRRMFIESLEDRKVLDAEPLLVKDINTSYNPVELNDASRMPTVLGSIGLYSGYVVASGRELWRTDGTVGGTSLIKDINAGPEDSVPQNFVEMGGSYYFTASTSDAGRELWKTDGTEAGTSMVMDIYPGNMSSNPSALYAADGQLYFSADSPEFGNELWVSDGTTAGTRQLVDIYPGFAFGVSDIYKFNNHLLFNSIISGQKITSLDLLTGTVEYPVNPVSFSSPVELSNGRLLFVGAVPSGQELWTTDGTIAGTTLLANFQPSGSSVATLWTRFNGSTIVSYPNGTTLVVASLSDDGVFETLVEVPAAYGELAVSAALPDRLLIASSSKLYSSDGTAVGTVEVTLQPGISVDIRDSAMFAGSLYFALTGEGFGVAKYDPVDGTLSRITENRQYQAFSFQTTLDGLYWLERPFIFNELQYFDGVTTESLYDDGENSWLYARALETINGNLVFVGVNGSGVALRGATSNSIVKLSPIDAGPTSNSLTSSNTVQLNGQQFMGVYLNGQIELWSTDGTEAGTNPLTSNPFAYFSPLQMVATNTKVFAVGLGPTGVELWTSDGTVAGTTLVTTLSFQPDWIVAYQDQVVMAGNGGLWASDGSESDLRLIASTSGTFAQTPAVWQEAMYFNGNVDGVDAIWKLQNLESPTLTAIPDSSGLRFIKTVTNDNAIAFTIAPPFLGAAADLWITRDGFATKNFVASNVLQMEFAGGMLYYSEGVPSGGISIKRSDAGRTLSAVDLGTFSQVILDEVDEVIYAKVSAPNDKWQVLSSTGPNGTLQVDADFSGFKDLVADWQFENLGGKALGSTRFAMYGAELGITSPSTRIVLQNSLITENNVPESIVGTIGTIWSNVDWGQATFSLVAGDGADSNSLFTIDTNNNLVSINSLDTEAQRLHSIRVRADYPGGQSIENVLTVFVQNVNETLDQVQLDGQTVSEGASIGTIFGKFVAPIAEPGEVITYELLSVDGNSFDMPFRTEGNLLLVNGPLDFETSANPSLEVRITSSLGLSVVRAFHVFVTDVNDPPAISNPNSDILVDADVWTSISLSDKFYDEDANDSLTFTASYNGGALPAWLFFSSFDTLAAIPTPADVGVYEIAITATDRAGASVTKLFMLTVEDPIDINGTLGDDTIRVTPTDTTGTAWSVFVNGTRTFTGVLTRSLLISGYTGNDRLIIEGTTVNDDFLFGGAIANVGALRTKFYDFESIQFAGRTGNDQFRFTGDANPVGSFAINGGTGTDTLVGADLPHVWTINGTDAGILGQITDAGVVARVAFASIENLAGGRSYNQFMMLTGGRITGSIEGRAGYDELNYSQRNANVAVTVADLELRAGTATNVTSFKGFEAFHSNPLQNSTFTLTDSVSERAMRWDLFADLIVTLEFTTTLVGFKSLVGSPNDDVFYSNEGASQINFDGSTGFDQIAQFGAYSTVDLRSRSGTGIASFRGIESFITYATQSELYGPNANSTWSVTFESVSVQGIAFQNYSTVFGGTRNDIFELAPLFSSTRNIVGGSGVDAIKTIDPFENFNSQANWLLTGVGSGQVTSMQATSLNFSGIENLVGGQVDFDFVNFASVPTQTWFTSLTGLLTGNIVVTYPASTPVTGTTTVNPVNDPPVVVNLETKTATGFGRWDFVQYWIANSNSDKLIGRNLDTNWFITGSGGASSDSRTNFEGFETIVGGSRNDTFQINWGTVAVPRRIEGGAGRNMLDFTNYPAAVTLDLTAGTGSPFAFGLSGFTDVIGSRFDDILSGNAADNILIGLDGNDLLRGLAGNDVLLGGNDNDQLQGGTGKDLLVGGWGADFLFGGTDDDLLISGLTYLFNNDNQGTYAGLDRNAIAAVMSEWTSTRTYAEKQARIRSGASSGGLYRLDSSNVFRDGAVDQLFGEGGRDWFWLDPLDFVQDGNNTETKDLV